MSSLTAAHFLRPFHALQVLLAGYGAWNSYIAIRNLQTYEEATKRAAKWTDIAQHQLDKTRSTQAAGVVSVTLSIVASVTLAAAPYKLPLWPRTLLSPVLVLGLVLARRHIVGYWGASGGVRVPLAGDYNEAERKTKAVLDVLEWLTYTWAISSIGWGLMR